MQASVSISWSEPQNVLLMELVNHRREQTGNIPARVRVHITSAGIFSDLSKSGIWSPHHALAAFDGAAAETDGVNSDVGLCRLLSDAARRSHARRIHSVADDEDGATVHLAGEGTASFH